jgi:hypothetical protein
MIRHDSLRRSKEHVGHTGQLRRALRVAASVAAGSSHGRRPAGLDRAAGTMDDVRRTKNVAHRETRHRDRQGNTEV